MTHADTTQPDAEKRRMSKAERHAWLLDYLTYRMDHIGGRVYVLLTDFVWRYIETTGAKFLMQTIGAPKCPMLGRDLSQMHKAGILKRKRTGIEGMGWGFPKWVWIYELSDAEREVQTAALKDKPKDGAS